MDKDTNQQFAVLKPELKKQVMERINKLLFRKEDNLPNNAEIENKDLISLGFQFQTPTLTKHEHEQSDVFLIFTASISGTFRDKTPSGKASSIGYTSSS